MRKGFAIGAVIGYIIGFIVRLIAKGIKAFVGLFTKGNSQGTDY